MQITNICNQCFYPGEVVLVDFLQFLVDFLQFLVDFPLSQGRHLLPLFAPRLLLNIKVNVDKGTVGKTQVTEVKDINHCIIKTTISSTNTSSPPSAAGSSSSPCSATVSNV